MTSSLVSVYCNLLDEVNGGIANGRLSTRVCESTAHVTLEHAQ